MSRDWYIPEKKYFYDDYDLVSDEILKDQIDSIVRENWTNTVEVVRPMELMTKMNESLSRSSNIFSQIINIRGIFKAGNGTLYKSGYYYDFFKDENNNTQIKILVPANLRQKIKNDSLVILRGMVNKQIDASRSSVELLFRVDAILEELKSKAISDDDLKRISLVQKKNEKGRKPVESILKNKLMKKIHPKIYIFYAHGTITDQDFDRGVKSAGTEIDFTFNKEISFANTGQLISNLVSLDTAEAYDAICLVRGGGSGMEKMDDIRLFDCLLNMKTPTIGGFSHVGEGFNVTNMVDYNTGTPSLLGQFFDNLVKETAVERDGAINTLSDNIRRQYKPQLERLERLEKTTEENQKTINKLNEEKLEGKRKFDELQMKYKELETREYNSDKWKSISILLFIATTIIGIIALYLFSLYNKYSWAI